MPASQSVILPTSLSVSQPVKDLVDQLSVSQPVKDSVGQLSVIQLVSKKWCFTIVHSIYQSIRHLVRYQRFSHWESTSQSVGQSVGQSLGQSVSQSISQSAGKSVHRPTELVVSLWTTCKQLFIRKLVSQSVSQLVSPSYGNSISKSAHQSVSLSVSQIDTKSLSLSTTYTGLKIVTDTVANATKTFNLATTKFEFSCHFGNHVPLINKRLKVRNNFTSLISAFLQKEMQIKFVYL